MKRTAQIDNLLERNRRRIEQIRSTLILSHDAVSVKEKDKNIRKVLTILTYMAEDNR